jgi:hypothetical protein
MIVAKSYDKLAIYSCRFFLAIFNVRYPPASMGYRGDTVKRENGYHSLGQMWRFVCLQHRWAFSTGHKCHEFRTQCGPKFLVWAFSKFSKNRLGSTSD